MMHSDNRSVDHLHRRIMCSSQSVHDPGPDTCPPPTNEAVVAGCVWAEVIGNVAPRCSGSQHPGDAIEDTPVVYPWHAARLVRQHRPDGCPFAVGEFVAHDSSPRFGGLNHDPRAGLNGPSIHRHLRPRRRFWCKPDINRLTKPADSVANAPFETCAAQDARSATLLFVPSLK